MERLLLARHAESESGVLGRVNGDLRSPSHLTEEGRAQARALGRSLAGEEIDLCATSEFPRTIETADLALEGRSVPRLVAPDLNEIGFGAFEGRPLADYRVWALAHGSGEEGPGGAESRLGAARRFARAFGELLAREERTILVVSHALAIRYLLSGPAAYVESVPLAEAHALTHEEAASLLDRLVAWTEAPTW
ncbi:MAG TPA: histidine phosphatase family protein [Gaiellaceae bacterium]|nr:histidine phosphatase family protein [Gaiellaceae bacterium]